MIKPSDPNLPNLDQLEKDMSDYLRMRTDSIKLAVVEGLSLVIGKGMALVIAIIVCLGALMVLSVALVLLVSVWVNSYILGAVIVGVFYLVMALVVWLLRIKFVDKMVGMFSRIIFSSNDD
jgi:uncharacterized membrane protein YdbT with pleckstrin-like domain